LLLLKLLLTLLILLLNLGYAQDLTPLISTFGSPTICGSVHTLLSGNLLPLCDSLSLG
jgi:hypothetical protein